MLAEVADDQMDLQPVILAGKRGGGIAQKLIAHIEGDVFGQSAELLERTEEDPRLVARPSAELDQCVGLGQLSDRRRVSLQQESFGPGWVVLREPGDLLEELAPSFVVEPDRRNGLCVGP